MPDGKFHSVTPVTLDVTVLKDGELQAVENIDVQCMVEGRTTIVHIVKEGTRVKKGDLLVELDSSLISQALLTSTLEKKQAETDLKTAQEMFSIQEGQNEADLQAAQVTLDLAKIALEQYTDGTYPQQLKTATTAVEMARIQKKVKEDDLAQVRELHAKTFVTPADVKAADLALKTANIAFEEAETALSVLTKYGHRMSLAGFQSAVSQAEQAQARVRKTAASMLSKARSDVETKTLALATKTKAVQKLQQQLDHCTIRSPSDGLVVYVYDDEDFRIAEGAIARERQRLIRLPDTTRMKVELKVNEGQVGKLKLGQRAAVSITGVKDRVGAVLTKISPVASTGSRWWNPDLKEYPIELELDQTPPGLQPGMTVQGEIYVNRVTDALAVPLPAVWSEQSTAYVFAREGDKVTPRPVKLGTASHTHVEVLDGLAKGDSVLLLGPGQGREFLERAGIATASDRGPSHNGPPPPPAQQAKKQQEQKAKDEQARQAKGQEDKAAQGKAKPDKAPQDKGQPQADAKAS
jgi:HlyD family secretion protein